MLPQSISEPALLLQMSALQALMSAAQLHAHLQMLVSNVLEMVSASTRYKICDNTYNLHVVTCKVAAELVNLPCEGSAAGSSLSCCMLHNNIVVTRQF